MTSEPVASTIVWHGDKAWRVSTINRNSSAVGMHDHIYAETMVWAWNPETRDVEGRILGMFDSGRDSLREHLRAVTELHELGRLKTECKECDGDGGQWEFDEIGFRRQGDCPVCHGSGWA